MKITSPLCDCFATIPRSSYPKTNNFCFKVQDNRREDDVKTQLCSYRIGANRACQGKCQYRHASLKLVF